MGTCKQPLTVSLIQSKALGVSEYSGCWGICYE